MGLFSKMSLLTCPLLRRKRVEKSQAILEHFMTFRSSILTGNPEHLLSLMCFILLMKTFYNVVNAIICCAKEARALIVLDIK